jgi:RimJ/RimL family protein N-acetyltransferase
MPLLPDRLDAGAIELHRWRPAHAPGLCAAVSASLDELRPWMPWAQEEPTVEGHVAVLADGEDRFDQDLEWQYVVVEPPTGQVAGAVGLHRRGGPATVEIGYWIRTDATGRGYATMASRALTGAAFTHLTHVDTVEIRMDRGNRRSAAVPPRLGFHRVAEVDQEIDAPGQCGRWWVWQMTRQRWEGTGGVPSDG